MGLVERWTWEFDSHQLVCLPIPRAAALFENVWALEKRRKGQEGDEVKKGGRGTGPAGCRESWHPLGLTHAHCHGCIEV